MPEHPLPARSDSERLEMEVGTPQFVECLECAAVIVNPAQDRGEALRRHAGWHERLRSDLAWAENPVIG